MPHTTLLQVIYDEVRHRADKISSEHGEWPCRKGCDECCRRLAAVPRVTGHEWAMIDTALAALPLQTRELVRGRIRDAANTSRPIVCPMLDVDSGACLIYQARPVACRTYGFYAEREGVLGCSRIERVSRESPEIVWGNHPAVEGRVRSLGPAKDLHVWLEGADDCESMAP